MIIEPIHFNLKDGRSAVLRNPAPEDAEGVLRMFLTMLGETDFLLAYPEEKEKLTVEAEAEILDKSNQSPDSLLLICEVEGVIAGDCDIRFNSRMKTGHRAGIGIGILKEYWNQGIGTAMFEAMISAAEKREGLLQLELEFIEGNARGRALYEKMGFRIVAMKPDAVKLKDGSLRNEYTMIRKM